MAVLPQKQQEILNAIICDGNAELLVDQAEKLAQQLTDLPSHQIRRLFGTVRQIQHTWRNEKTQKKAQRDLVLLKYKLAYQRKRIKEIGKLEEVLGYAITLVGADETRFNNFVDFFEAIVAYHTAMAKG